MNEKLKAFLDAKKYAEKKAYEEKKNQTLIELGLFEKVYSEKEMYSNDFPYSEYDNEKSRTRWYKKEAVSISDEEYEEVKKYSDIKQNNHNNDEKNLIATIFKVLASVIYIAGFVASFILGLDRYGDISAMVIVWWIVFFVLGTIYLGFGEIIQLLDDIKKK